MSLPPPSAISYLRCSVNSYKPLLRSDAVFVFICGANKSERCPNPARDDLLEYAKKHYQGFTFFRAEDVFSSFQKTSSIDLLTLENQIADYSDCIIIVCESESAFAELGAFTLDDRLVQQVLIVNDEQHRESTSFITHGPIARADKKSNFKPTIYANFRAILKSAMEIEKRLKKIQKSNRISINLKTFEDLSKAKPKHKILFLADIIHFFSPIKVVEIIHILRCLYGDKSFKIDLDIALLEGLGFLRKSSTDFILYNPEHDDFFYTYGGLKPTYLRSMVVRHYSKNERSRLKHLFPS